MTSWAAILVAASLAGSPSYSVVVTRRVGLAAPAGLDLAEMLSVALERQAGQPLGRRLSPRALSVVLSAANTSDTTVCAGSLDCVAALGRLGGVDQLVALQIVKLGSDLMFDASLVQVAGGASVAVATGSTPEDKPAAGLEALAADLASKAAAAATAKEAPPEPVAAKPPDAPRAVDLPPPAIEERAWVPNAAAVAPIPTAKRQVPLPSWILGGSGAAFAVAGATFGALNLSIRSSDHVSVDGGVTRHSISYSQARLQDTSATLAPTFLSVGGVLLASAVIWALVSN